MKAKKIYNNIKEIYNNFKKFFDQLSLLIQIVNKNKEIQKEELIKMFYYSIDIYESSLDLWTILKNVTWTGNGKNAIEAFIRYKLLYPIPFGFIRKWIAGYIVNKIIPFLRKWIPKPVKSTLLNISDKMLPQPKIKKESER